MKNFLIGMFMIVLFFFVIYGLIVLMSYGYYHWNFYVSFAIDLVVIVVVMYVIEFSVKKIDQINNHDE